MRICNVRGQHLLKLSILSLALLAGLPGTGQAVKPMEPPFCVPKAFRQLGASVVSLRFYASQTNQIVPMQARRYSASFTKGNIPYIWWELCLNNRAKRNFPVPLIIWVVWQRPDGSEFTQSVTATIPPNIPQPCLTALGHDKQPGGWSPGSYRVSIQIDDIEVASGSFDMFEKFMKEK